MASKAMHLHMIDRIAEQYGLETFSIPKSLGEQEYLTTPNSKADKIHIAAAGVAKPNIVVTICETSDGEIDQISSSLRHVKIGEDPETVALHKTVLDGILNKATPEANAGLTLSSPKIMNQLGDEVLPSVKRTVHIHLYPAVYSEEAPLKAKNARMGKEEKHEPLISARRRNLYSTLPRLTQCKTLVMAFEGWETFFESGLDVYFISNPKRGNLNLELRIGSIWSIPTVTPHSRILKDGVLMSEVLTKSKGRLSSTFLTTSMDQYRSLDDKRDMALKCLYEALGEGMIVPYGTELVRGMYRKEVWIWAASV